MADYNSADIFGNVFKILAENPEKNKDIAKRIYSLITEYDFHQDDMNAFESLEKLGLAHKYEHPKYGIMNAYNDPKDDNL